jgi:RNA polymerase sigma-70 factor (ECF subfamily)
MESSTSRTHDEWIAIRCRLGEPGAFAELVREMERPLLYYAVKLLADEHAAFDVLQEVWLVALRAIRRLDDPRSVRPWLYRLTRSRAVDRVRSDRSRGLAQRARAESVTEEMGEDPSFDDDDAAALHRALDELDLRHRDVLVLHFLDELSIAEIASIVGDPAGTVKSRIYYAKRALKEALARKGHEQTR